MAQANPIRKFPEKVLKSLKKLKISDTDINFALHGIIPPKIKWAEVKKILSRNDYDNEWLPSLRVLLVEKAKTKIEFQVTFPLIKEDSNLRFKFFRRYTEYLGAHAKQISMSDEISLLGEYIFLYDSLFYTLLNICEKNKTTEELDSLYEACPKGKYEHSILSLWRDFQLGKAPYTQKSKKPKVIDLAFQGDRDDKKLEPIRMNLIKEFLRIYNNKGYAFMRKRYKLLRKILYTYYETTWYY